MWVDLYINTEELTLSDILGCAEQQLCEREDEIREDLSIKFHINIDEGTICEEVEYYLDDEYIDIDEEIDNALRLLEEKLKKFF